MKFFTQLVDALFASIWGLFCLVIGGIVLLIGGYFLYQVFFDEWRVIAFFLSMIGLLIIYFIWNNRFHENWSKKRKQRTQEILEKWKKEGKID